MSLIDELDKPKSWRSFLRYKTSILVSKRFEKELRSFMEAKSYESVCEGINNGEPFPLPRKAVISKMTSTKKRTVYIYPKAENMVLKLLTHLILRKYDHIFADGLYSFRPGRTAKDAVRRLIGTKDIGGMYFYKVDISNYFNSIDVDMFLPLLKKTLSDDPRLYSFLAGLLLQPGVLDSGKVITEKKGIMAGTPVASFYANLYLSELDSFFEEKGATYVRYSDDIIVFAKDEEKITEYADVIKEFLKSRGLEVNPKKESYGAPGDMWSFLGFCYRDDKIDIAPASIRKLKGKMRRKSRALLRWRQRNGVDGAKAASAFIRIFNRKLMEQSDDNDLTWSYWFFTVINTTESLHEIDLYAQESIRFIMSGTHKNSKYNVRYEDMKALGYKSLVHEYYDFPGKQKDRAPDSIRGLPTV